MIRGASTTNDLMIQNRHLHEGSEHFGSITGDGNINPSCDTEKIHRKKIISQAGILFFRRKGLISNDGFSYSFHLLKNCEAFTVITENGAIPPQYSTNNSEASAKTVCDSLKFTRDGASPPRDGMSPPRDGMSPPRDGMTPPRDGMSPPRDGIAASKALNRHCERSEAISKQLTSCRTASDIASAEAARAAPFTRTETRRTDACINRKKGMPVRKDCKN
ncbi:MAG: hypothetical protein LBJ47_11805 [Tannerella sp.]|jgi:hypothetical protein|nr:hypothetical protein [Tannerella sp.]